jgi:hypothetical protein
LLWLSTTVNSKQSRTFIKERALQTIEYDLEPGQTQALRDIAITEIRVIRGRLWITQYGDITDYFLGTGQAISLQGTSVVVQAERDGATFFLRTSERGAAPISNTNGVCHDCQMKPFVRGYQPRKVQGSHHGY